MTIRERYEKETGLKVGERPQSITGNMPTIEYVQWLESLLEWIPESEELPTEHEEYNCLKLINNGSKWVEERYLFDTRCNKWFSCDWDGEEQEFPMYWRRNIPLPPLPEDLWTCQG